MLDPGGEEAVAIAQELKEQGIEVKHVLVSHGHFDHLGWAAEVQDVVEGATVYLHEDEQPNFEYFLDQMPAYGLDPVDIREPDVWIRDKQVLELSDYRFEVIHTPGHSPGSATYRVVDTPTETDYIPLQANHSAFVGDCLFQGSIGRVDLPYSDPNAMITSLKRLMEELDDTTSIYPGHGNDSTMGIELRNNPYLLAIQRGVPIF